MKAFRKWMRDRWKTEQLARRLIEQANAPEEVPRCMPPRGECVVNLDGAVFSGKAVSGTTQAPPETIREMWMERDMYPVFECKPDPPSATVEMVEVTMFADGGEA